MTSPASPGSDFLHLDPAAAPPGGLTRWLVDAVREAIADGRLPPGSRLPATRVLAGELGLSRGVVVEAYRRLADEGVVTGRAGSATTVARFGDEQERSPSGSLQGREGTVLATARGPAAAGAASGGPHQAGPDEHSAAGTHRSPRLPRLASHARGEIELDLSPGVPDLSAFPRTAWLRAERAVLDQAVAADLGYGDPRGSPRLRAELAGWLRRTRGLRAVADDVMVVSGVAQALALLAQTLRAGGATEIAVEDPGSRGARDELAHWGLVPVAVPVDVHGLDVTQLSASGCTAVLITPAHQFPTGVVLAPHRRRELVGWAASGGLVVEDDYDAEHRYDRPPVPALQGTMPEQVAHAGSTSKSLAPGMRLGWLVAPRRLRADLVAAKHASDLGSPALPQLALAHLLASGAYDRQLRLVRRRLRARRDAVVDAIGTHLPQARVEGVAAGLHVLVTLPGLAGPVRLPESAGPVRLPELAGSARLPELAGPVGSAVAVGSAGSVGSAGAARPAADAELAERLEEAGVLVQPLSWHRQRPGPQGLVLGYAAHPPDRLREAVRRIGEVVRREDRRGRPAGGGHRWEATTAPSASTRPTS